MTRAFDGLILDPPRSGAWDLLPWIAQSGIPTLVYVSCNPATFIRDAAWLTKHGYRLEKIGLMDMFPHTQHAEVMGLLVHE